MHDSSTQARMDQMMTGYWVTQMVYVAAKLGLADLLVDGARTSADLAEATGTCPHALYRLLRALASLDVFVETAPQQFALTPLAECLRTDLPGSQRAAVIMSGEEHYRAWGELMYSVRTGQPAFEKLFDAPVFQYLEQHPDSGAIFDAAMTGIHGREAAAVAEACDLSGAARLVDVGGGNGSQLLAILDANPSLRGTLFDLPQVVERARPGISRAASGPRCELRSGSFFESIPPGADAYLLRHIIHDWNDEQAAVILRNCREAMLPESRLLLIETVIPPGNGRSFAKLLDLTMLVIPGGLERTESEYRALLASCGLLLTKIVPTQADVSIIEAVRAT